MYIDTHVHLRGFKESYKQENVKHGLEVARDSGVYVVCDMPNTDPTITTLGVVEDRLKLARDACIPEVQYKLFVGLTADAEQVKQAVEIYREFFPHVIGFKLYAGHSVGNLGVVKIHDQIKIYETLLKQGYEGLLVVHAEKQSLINEYRSGYRNPIFHCYARPEKAEIESVKDQLKLVHQTEFNGKLHIAHISSPRAVELVHEARQQGVNVSCAVTPHHIIYDWTQMQDPSGLLWKMNPPLRSPESKDQMLRYLRKGMIDWIETDHAPHNLDEKLNDPWMSGIPGLPWWPLFEEFLRYHNFSDKQIFALTFENARKRLGIDIDTSKKRKYVDRRSDYAFNPYTPIEEMLGWSR